MLDPWAVVGKIVEWLGLTPKNTKYRYKRDCERCMRYLVQIRKLHAEIEEHFQESRIIQLKIGSHTLRPNEYGALYNRLEILTDIQRKDQTEMDNLQADLDYIVSKYI